MIAQKLTDKWGQQVIVENKPGAAGVIGSEQVAKSAADGYTLLMATAGNLTVNQHLYKNMRFDPVKDFTPIAQTAGVDFVLVTQPTRPSSNVKELVAAAKAKPDTITSATSGNGGAPHLAAALFENEAGVDLNLVPYKGTADAVNAVLGGQTQLDFDAASQVRAARSRPASSSRWPCWAPSARRCCRTCRPWPRPACPSTTSATGSAWSARPACPRT